MKLALTLLLTVPLAAQPAIRPTALRAHMEFLASDLLEGRGTGTRGYAIAAEYVAAQYEAMGLKPAGSNGTYFQNVPFRSAFPNIDASMITLTRSGSAEPITLKWGESFVSSGMLLDENALAEGDLVSVGFGVTSPEQHYDDYAGADVKGKIVVIFSGAPEQFPNDLRAHYSSSSVKLDNAAARGAIGVLTVTTPADEKRAAWSRYVRQSKLGTMAWLEAGGTPHGVRPEILATATMSHDAARTLFEGSPVPLDKLFDEAAAGRAKPVALPAHARVNIVSKRGSAESPNVIGIVPGSDPQLKNEYVVYSAHLDHLGISAPVDGDSINNGALDNASGIAAILEIARAFMALPKHPRRSILFLASTGEEKGLKGADYFANNPTVPAASLVANINIDEILMFHPTRDMVAIGGEHSTLGKVAAGVATKLGVELSPDPYPEEVVFVRSDQYPFVKRGVPAIFVDAGHKAVDPRYDVLREQLEWIKTKYHSPKDDMSQKLDYSVGAAVALFDYEIGLAVADAEERPRWNAGDFFGEKFGR